MLKESNDLDISEVIYDLNMTFEKHLRSISRAASQRLLVLTKSWRIFHDRLLPGRCFRGFVLPVLEYCTTVWCSAGDTHLEILVDRVVSGARFLRGLCLSVTLRIADLWQFYACCTESVVTRCTVFKVLYLGSMCLCGLHAVLWSHIGILMLLLAPQPRSTTGPLFFSPCPRGTILLTLYSMVWYWRVLRAGSMHIYWQ